MFEVNQSHAYPARFMSADRAVVKRAIADAFPLYIPAIPFALVIGVAVIETGMNPFVGWTTAWMIFGGAAQITLVALLGSGSAVAAAVAAAIVVNARHLMYSAALTPKFQEQPRWFRWLGPYVLIDQVFALVMLRQDNDPKTFRTYYLACGLFFWSFWQVTIITGLFIGPVIPDEWNLAFAVPILFLGLVVMGIDRFPKLVAALVAAAVTFLFAGLPSRSGLLVGAVVGIVAGTLTERWASDE